MAESVKVAVRVRPFNSREQRCNAKLIIRMSGNQTEIQDPETGQNKKFAFDYSYWSHDEYKEQPDGYLVPAGTSYADQKVVFNDLGVIVLDNAWAGYNTSLFAYGQTGSGKSYSMIGYGVNKGIVPLSCERLFQQIEQKRAGAKEGEDYQVTISMLEIYNEQVRDLLTSGKAQKGGLRVREHQSKGFYVEGLISAGVNSYADIDAKHMEGTKNRTVAATNMNASSSRAHTIVAITFTQKTKGPGGQSMTKSSTINLVDLAGSERAESTGATGDRLKEGSSINQSLSALGNCIKALADHSSGDKRVAVPFRNSVLTKLLKNALGGNSKTVMIAALSPADINYEETLSTLRFADRAKAIKTQAVINESPTDKLIRELREENEKLKLSLGGGAISAGAGAMDEEMAELMRRNEEELEKLRKTNEELIKSQEQAAASQPQTAKPDQAALDAKRKTTPHLWNLNADPSLCGFIVHFVESGKIRVGAANNQPKNDIELTGLEIQKEHAVIINKKDTILLKPCKGAVVKINGTPVTGENLLKHNDRILFGSSLFYVVHHPKELAKLEKKGHKVPSPTYEDAQEDIGKGSGLAKLAASSGTEPDDILMQDLSQTLIMVHEANEISKALNKKVKFEVSLMSPMARGLREGRTEVVVKMRNLTTNHEWTWDRNKFINRKYLMQEMYQNYIDGDDWDKPEEQDPFWEAADMESCFGVVQVLLQSVGFLIDIESAMPINDFQGNEIGHLQVQLIPCTENWSPIEDDFVEDPTELIGRSLNFKLRVPYARGLPKQFQSSFCQFKFFTDAPIQSNEVNKAVNPNYDYEKRFSFSNVTPKLVEYLTNDFLVIEMWGRQTASAEPSSGTVAGSDTAPKAYDAEEARLQAELRMLRMRCGNAEFKLGKIKKVIGQAKKNKKDSIQLSEIELAVKSNKKWLAVGKSLFLMHSVRNSRQAAMGQATSSACEIQ